MNPPNVMMHVFDPGKTTGYACLQIRTGHNPVVIATFEIPEKPFDMLDTVRELIARQQDAQDATVEIVAEEFRVFPGAAKHLVWDSLPAAKMFGAIEYMAFLCGLAVIHQRPSDMKKLNDEVLTLKLGLSKLPSSPHEKDALRHGLYRWVTVYRDLKGRR